MAVLVRPGMEAKFIARPAGILNFARTSLIRQQKNESDLMAVI